ncbi:UNVERIFIED_CONTAM: hypothetical protein K2H54_045966 [Gekko kuhli]
MASAPPRTVLITGCSSGIGLRIAVQLAQDPGGRFRACRNCNWSVNCLFPAQEDPQQVYSEPQADYRENVCRVSWFI